GRRSGYYCPNRSVSFSFGAKLDQFFFFDGLKCLKETVSPDFVNLALVGFVTVFMATDWTFFFAMLRILPLLSSSRKNEVNSRRGKGIRPKGVSHRFLSVPGELCRQ